MPEPKRPLKVFLCYASADKPAVRSLYKRLVADGVDVWLDAESLVAGQNWQVEIPKSIRESDVVIVCLSEKSINKEGYVQREIKFALDVADEKPEGTIFIVPAKLEECKVPDRLSMYHWVELFEKDGYERLLRALRRRADNIGATLQIKKSWLPNISSSYQTQKDKIKSRAITQIESNEPDSLVRMPAQKPKARKLFGNTVLLFWSIFVFGAIALMWKPVFQIIAPLTEEKTPQIVATPTYTETIATSTLEPTVTPTFLPTEITDAKGVSMVLVPEGEFIMGGASVYAQELPVHTVFLDAYYIDKYEVTNSLYSNCVIEGGCSEPHNLYPYNNSGYSNNPIVNITWSQAVSYCEWRGATLPTEAEWEKAARGVDGRVYPWGENIDCTYANFGDCKGRTVEVDSYEKGQSPFGVFNMLGNVSEWVSDWYSFDYYSSSPVDNPNGPIDGTRRVARGASWIYYSKGDLLSITKRWSVLPDYWSSIIGFRCAKDASS